MKIRWFKFQVCPNMKRRKGNKSLFVFHVSGSITEGGTTQFSTDKFIVTVHFGSLTSLTVWHYCVNSPALMY